MRIAGNIVGVVMVLRGAIWVLQGSNMIGGSVMSGESRWTIIGVIVALVGLAVLWWANRRRAHP